MAVFPTGSNLTIQDLAYSLGYSASAEAVTGSGNVDLGSIVKRFCGTTHATSSTKYIGADGGEAGGIGLGDWGVDKFLNPTANAAGGVTNTTGASTIAENGNGLIWARVQNCGQFWSSSAHGKETVGGDGTYWTWVENTGTGFTADAGDININTTGNFTASYATPDDSADDGNQTFQATFKCEDEFNTSATNYNTTIASTFTITESGTGSGGAGGGGASCLKIGTEILMKDGSWVRIENIQINDEIQSVNFPTLPDGDKFGDYEFFYSTDINEMELTTSVILSTEIDYFYEHLKITDSNGDIIEVTGTHPLLVYSWDDIHHASIIKFKRASDITTDDKLVTSTKEYLDITSIVTIKEEEQMCIFNAEDVDTGIARIGNNTFIIHNGKGE